MVLCTYCNKEYKTKYTLKTHQDRNACLKNKVSIDPVIYNCEFCECIFTSKRNLEHHNRICKTKKVYINKKDEKLEIMTLHKTIQNKDLEILNLKDKVAELKEEIKELRMKPTTIINNDNRIQNNVTLKAYIKNSKAITTKALAAFVSKLNIGHILDGGIGLANYYIQNIQPEHSIVCNDLSRQICMYKNDKEKIYKDPRLLKFIKDFSNSVHIPAKDLVDEYCKNDWIKDDIVKMRELMEIVKDINMAKTGNKARFVPSFVGHICASTLAENISQLQLVE